jgi:hypothetical protein
MGRQLVDIERQAAAIWKRFQYAIAADSTTNHLPKDHYTDAIDCQSKCTILHPARLRSEQGKVEQPWE